MSVTEDPDDEVARLHEEHRVAPDDPPAPPAVSWVRDPREGTVTLYESGHSRPDIVGCWLTIDDDHATEVSR